MEKVVLKANKRNVVGKQVKALRREGKLPAVIYGRHSEPINIELEAVSSGRILAKATSSSLITIELDGEKIPTLVREKQRDFIKNTLLHVDFLSVSMTEILRASVALRFKGVSLAVKDFNAILVHNIEALNVECLPADLPEYVEVGVSALKNPGDGIRVGELPIPANVTVLDDEDMMVAVASASKIEEALAEIEELEEAEGITEAAVEDVALVGEEEEGEESDLSKEEEGGE
ncbi:MAG TPA: 50S ribosomal protein L25 [Anaerolineales bacterium]|nr:50S ribosomal protein L25 [Anaerolineales bacterium]